MIIFWRGRPAPPPGRGTTTGWWIRGWIATAFLLGVLCVAAPVIGISLILTLVACHVAIVIASRERK